MLETRELCKIYKPKRGVPVTALDHVSIRFPQKGMVFLLGKSGSGKSTLLNLLGGLDTYDGGEILIKGESSRNFKQRQFDSYRNTYVGFIFQEYNVLDEFTVGANIALAIELQNRKADDEEINRILEQVDLAGYGQRKPNELSGGQKQRVAIARALVKNPEIIMADEPTGALDSQTGRQVLETLKRLSADKLVIVVSHDREFAENYADRIIELADGRVISDVELDENARSAVDEGLCFDGDRITIPPRYHLTEQDREQINAYIDSLSEGAQLSVGARHSAARFKKTDAARIKTDYPGGMQLIKSRLPLRSAVKIGAGGLKFKKFRLVMTILLSCIAFGLFGLSDTFGSYDHIRTCTNSIQDTGVKSAAVVKSKLTVFDYWNDWGFTMTAREIDDISKKTGVKMRGVYAPGYLNFDFSDQLAGERDPDVQYPLDYSCFTGFCTVDNAALSEMGLSLLAGSLPDGSRDEAAVSEYTFEVFQKYGVPDADGKKITITSYSDLIGRTVHVADRDFKITGIVDTGLDIERYKSLNENTKAHYSKAEEILRYALYNEFTTCVSYSAALTLMVGDGYIDRLISQAAPVFPIMSGYIAWSNEKMRIEPQNFTTLNRIPAQNILWVDGEKNVLSENEIIVTSDLLEGYEADESPEETGNWVEQAKKLGSLELHGFEPYSEDGNIDESGKKIVGVLPITEQNRYYASTVIVPENIFTRFTADCTGPYAFAIGKMPENREEVEQLVSGCYAEENGVRYPLQNSVTYELDSINSILHELSKAFLYIGIGFACFAALMLANFIATSISHKKQEIGILRAIGSRSNDVFRIFFSESLIIAAINFVLSSVGVFAATMIINYTIRSQLGVLITVLSFGPRQILLLLGVSVLVALLASYLPVKRIASKRPIDAIRDR